jgi:ribosome-associated protein
MIEIANGIAIDESEVQEDFVRASGPGGQNVNKLATAVQLRFDAANSPSLSAHGEVRRRLASLAGAKMTKEGVLIIRAQRFRTQEANRKDALERLVELLRRAAQKPVVRRKTRPTLASKERRLDAKRRRGETKRMRRGGDEG